MDLFDKNEDEDKGFHVEAARMLVKIYHYHYPKQINNMYPFNHIRVAAQNGQTSLKKPTNSLTPKTANRLKELGYTVTYSLEDSEWTISWV